MKQPDIYIHVGMGRAGSTFLQYRVFPKIRGLHYIQRTKFRKAKRIISRGKWDRYLVSGELDNRFIEKYLKDFTDPCDFAYPVIVIRRHDEWIASQYRRYLKNGNHWRFCDFFDIEDDQGYWKRQQLYYYPVIELLEKYFRNKPLVMLYDDLRSDPNTFVRRIVEYMDADINMTRIKLSPKHASYNEKQLRAIYSIGGKINLKKQRPFNKKWKNVLVNLHVNLLRYVILHGSRLLPGKLFTREDIFPANEMLLKIREFYEEDWERCKRKSEYPPS